MQTTFDTATETLVAVARIDALPIGWFVFNDVSRPTTGRWYADTEYDGARLAELPVRVPARIGDDRQLRGQCARALRQAIVARKLETAIVRGAQQEAA